MGPTVRRLVVALERIAKQAAPYNEKLPFPAIGAAVAALAVLHVAVIVAAVAASVSLAAGIVAWWDRVSGRSTILTRLLPFPSLAGAVVILIIGVLAFSPPTPNHQRQHRTQTSALVSRWSLHMTALIIAVVIVMVGMLTNHLTVIPLTLTPAMIFVATRRRTAAPPGGITRRRVGYGVAR